MQEKADDSQTLSISRVLAAPPTTVFEAWTNPDHLKNWWRIDAGWTVSIVSVDLRKGGAFRLGLKALDTGKTHIVDGTYHEIVPQRRLVFSFIVEGEEPQELEELVTVEFHEIHGDTRMELTHTRVRKGEPELARKRGWEATLGNLGNYLSARRTAAKNDS